MKKWKVLFSLLTLGITLAASVDAEAAIDTGKLPLQTYVAKRVYCSNSPGSTSNGYWIDAERDLVTIKKYQGEWGYGTYPNSKGQPVTRWFRMSDVLSNIGFANYEADMKKNQTVYRNSNSSNTIGTVYNNEKVVVVGESNGRTQIIYRLSNGKGYKMGWVPDSTINKVSSSSSGNNTSSNNTSGRVVPSSTITTNPVINNYLNANDNNVVPPQNSNYASWKGIATIRATAYLNSGLSRKQGIEWVGKGDSVTVYGEEGNAYFIEYPLSKGGTKHRWVRKNVVMRATMAEAANNSFSNATIDSTKVDLQVPYYRQNDSRWKNTKIGTNTIGNRGCLLTCLAMKYSYQTGQEVYPNQMKNKLSFSNNDLIWSSINQHGFSYSIDKSFNNDVMKEIYNALINNKPVIVGNTSIHWVLVKGYSGNDPNNISASDFVILDPASTTRTTLQSFFTAKRISRGRIVY